MSNPHNSATSSLRATVHERYQHSFKLLAIALGAAALASLFLYLCGEALEGDTHSLDIHLLLAAQSLRVGHSWVVETMRDLSGLGSTIVLTLITGAAVGYLVLVRERRTAWLLAASALTGSALVSVFKLAFGRLRPDAAYADVAVSGLSFPSGHASMSAIVFLTLGALLASTRTRLPEQLYILITASVMTVLVGVSRVALGAHWASDVLGGWAFGAAWAMLWLLLARTTASR
jgi:undecaprenyl-diphosphatase